MTTQKRVLTCAIAIAIAIAVAACGSSSKSSSSSSASGAASTATSGGKTSATSAASAAAPAAKKATGTPFNLGTVASCSGAEASGLGGACPTIKAWASWVNAHGGINGHPVKMTVLDDASNPSTSLTDLKTLIAQDHVQAIVGEYSIADPTWIPYITSSGVPVVGGASTEQPFAISPDFFPSGGQTPSYEYAEAVIAKRKGATKLGMMECAEAPTCATNSVITAQMIKDGLLPGQQLVYTTKIAATQPSYTAECLAAKAAGVQALLVADAGAIAQRVVDQCAQQGFKPIIMTGGGVLNPVLAKDANFDGVISTLSNPGLSDTSSAANQTLLAALKQYAPSLTPSMEQWNATVPEVWSGGLLFQAAAKAGHLTPNSSPAQIKKALYATSGTTLGGAAGSALHFKPGVVTQANCAFIESAANGKMTVSTYGAKPICVPGDTSKYMKVEG